MRSFRALAVAATKRILKPFVPARKMLPFNFWLYRLGGSCEPELLHLDELIGSAGTAIDVGANVGLFTYAFSKRFQRVYSFEINEGITGAIARYNPGNIELIHCGLSSESRTLRFYVPVFRGIPLDGWGSLNRDNLPEAERLVEKDVQVAPLDSFGIKNADFIKIDVEGHEMEVLEGARETISQSRPIVLTELKKQNLSTADAWFEELDYRRCALEDLIGVRGHRSNHIYVPIERLKHFGIAR